MQDFNLRPEITGFGRPERLLAVPAPTLLPADQWTRRGDFEVNGLGQLRTVLALPASEAEIAASMRHVDAPPIPRRAGESFREAHKALWASVDLAAGGDNWAIHTFVPKKDYVGSCVSVFVTDSDRCKTPGTDAVVHGMLGAIPQLKAVQERLNVEMLALCGKVLDAQDVPQHGRHYWDGNKLHTSMCHCDNCVTSRQGRFQPHAGDDPRPLIDRLKAPAAVKRTVLEASCDELIPLLTKLKAECGVGYVREILKSFGGDNLRAIPFFRHAELKVKLQEHLDIPF